ncbi:MAG: CRISPR-associated endonuclease Cas2 [Bacteroidota bacterium]
MPILICYDISNNSLRTKMGKRIIEKGLLRINKSVYLGTIKDTPLQLLERELTQWLAAKGGPDDSLIFLPVAVHQIKEMRVYGKNDLDNDEIVGEKLTLII